MILKWFPAIVLIIGAALTAGGANQRSIPLQKPLEAVVPGEILGYQGQDLTISEAESAVAGFSNYLFRIFESSPRDSLVTATLAGPVPDTEPEWFSLYVGYYESQTQGSTIHTPKNCLPGAGWEPLSSDPLTFEVGDTPVTVNKYYLQNELERALVLYWYQGRGRVEHDEYRVKFDLLRDAAFRRRSDEALVRLVLPVDGDDTEPAIELGMEAAEKIIPLLDLALPSG
jgi:EpsI family protein